MPDLAWPRGPSDSAADVTPASPVVEWPRRGNCRSRSVIASDCYSLGLGLALASGIGSSTLALPCARIVARTKGGT